MKRKLISLRKIITLEQKYVYGCFENGYVSTLMGFVYRTESQLKRKIARLRKSGWNCDDVLVPLCEVEELPSYVETVW